MALEVESTAAVVVCRNARMSEDGVVQAGTQSDRGGSVGHSVYRADIDGLRAVAVLAVVLFHAGFAVPGGFVGVDVFFVISGYLITGLIAADLDRGGFSLVDFWNRRLRRIWPAALVVTIAVLVAGWCIMLPVDLRILAADAIAQVTMLANFRFWKGTDYFDPSVDLRPLLHTWSLAVEEQFYLLFPLVMMMLWRFGRRTLLVVLFVLAAASLSASMLLLGQWPMAVFYLLPFRAWEMLLGAIVAVAALPSRSSAAWRHALSLGGLAAIGVPCFIYDRETLFPGAAALPPCLGAAALLAAGPRAWGNRMLIAEPLRRVGLASYSIYLWHWPVLAFLRYCIDLTLSVPVVVAALTVTAMLAVASYRWVETPFRRGWPARYPGRFTIAVASVSALVVAAGFAVRRLDGVPGRFTPEARQLLAAEQWAHDWEFDGDITTDAGRRLKAIGRPTDDGHACFLLWGDSHAMAISPAVDAVAREFGIAGRAALVAGLVPLPLVEKRSGQDCDAWRAWQESLMQWIREHRPKHVILCARWSVYAGVRYPESPFNATMVRASVDEAAAGPADFAGTGGGDAVAAMRRGLKALLAECETTGSTLWLLLEVPYQPAAARHGILSVQWRGGKPSFKGVDRAAHARRVGPGREFLAGCASPRLRVVDLAEPLFDEDGVSRVGGDGRFWYEDDSHVNSAAAHGVLSSAVRGMFEVIAADCGRRSLDGEGR